MLPLQQALRSLRRRDYFASLQTGPTVFSGTGMACLPERRPRGFCGVVTRLRPCQQALRSFQGAHRLLFLQPKRQFAAITPVRYRFAAKTPIRCKFAAKTPVRCRLPANLQPKRQFADCRFAAKTPICSQNASSLPICSQNANSLQICNQNASSLPIAGLQPKRQFAARTPVRCRFAAKTPIRCKFAAKTPVRCRLPVCSPNANLQPERQFAARLQPKRQFAADCEFAALTPICSQNANSLPICSPISRFNAFLQPKRISAAQTHVSQHRLCPCSCSDKALSEIIGAVKPCHRMLSRQQALQIGVRAATGVLAAKSRLNLFESMPFGLSSAPILCLRNLRGGNPFASLQTGPTVFSGTRIACFPDNRPCGVFGDRHSDCPPEHRRRFQKKKYDKVRQKIRQSSTAYNFFKKRRIY